MFGADNWGRDHFSECLEVYACAADHGVTLLDTAPVYGFGLAETTVGEIRKRHPQKMAVATKCGLVRDGAGMKRDLRPASIRSELELSLKRLQMDCIDLYQLHWPDPATPVAETMGMMKRLQKEGKIRHIGVSNVTVADLEEAMKEAVITSVQIQYSLLHRDPEKDVLDFCKAKGLPVMAYGCLGGGVLTGKYRENPELHCGDRRKVFQSFYTAQQLARIHQAVESLEKSGRALNEIAINWVRSHPAVTSVLLGCRDAGQMRANLNGRQWDMSEEERKDAGRAFTMPTSTPGIKGAAEK